MIINVAALPEEGTVYAGLYADDPPEVYTFVHAYYDNDTNTVGLEARVNGQNYVLGTTEPEQRLFEEPFRFAFVANENRVIALVSSPSDLGNWRPLIERDVFFETEEQLDLRDQTRLEPSPTALRNGFGARSDMGSNILIDRVRAGYFGEAGIRDPHVVQYADGTPYIKDNKLYFTLTNAGLGFFEKAHWGVWTMNLSDYTDIEQVGNIFWRNAPPSNVPPDKVLGHHAGQIIRDEEFDGGVGRWIVVVSSWGDFGPQGGDRAVAPGTVTYPDTGSNGEPVDLDPNNPNDTPVVVAPYEPPVDILYDEKPLSLNIFRGVHVLEGKKHPVNNTPFPTEGKWDPGLTRIDGVWYLAYVIALDLFTDFQPALARSPVGAVNPDHLDAIEFVGADWEKRATEGPIIQKLGGEWRLFASCGDDEPARFEGRYPIYFLEAANPGADENECEAAEAGAGQRLQFDGYLDAPHPTNIPHPQIVPISFRSGGRARTKYIMITFNGDQYYIERLGYGTHGDFYVMQAEQTVRGREF